MNNTKKKIFRKFGLQLIHRGENILKDTFDIKLKKITYKNLRNKIKSKMDLFLPLRDENYYLTSWDLIAEIIEYDWTNKRDYIVDRRDCDDFAEKFCANLSWLYGINSCFPISVELLNPETKKHIGYHRAVLVATKSGNLYMYDPMEGMKDNFIKIRDKDNIIIKNWLYKPRIIRN